MRAHGVTLLVAAPGYGKSAWIEDSMPDGGVTVRAENITVGELEEIANHPPAAVAIEDLHLLLPAEQAALVAAAGNVAETVPVYLSSRLPLDSRVRAGLTSIVHERGPADLRLTDRQVTAVLLGEYALDDPELVALVKMTTAGWPTLVHVFADHLSRLPHQDPDWPPGDVARFSEFHRDIGRDWVLHTVLPAVPERARDLLSRLAVFDVLTEELVVEVCGDQGPWVRDDYALLCRVGLVERHPRWALLHRPATRLVPAVAAHLRQRRVPGDRTECQEFYRRAAHWFHHHDFPFSSALASARCGDTASVRERLRQSGLRMLDHGDADGVVELLEADSTVDAHQRGLSLLHGQALLLAGRSGAAVTTLQPLVRAAGSDGWTAELSYAVALAHYTCGELALARKALARVDDAQVPATRAGIKWRALGVTLTLQGGDQVAAVALADHTWAVAEESADPALIAHARQAVAKVRGVSSMAALLGSAADDMRLAGDVVGLAAVLCNHTHALLTSARFSEAAVVGREAVAAVEIIRPVGALVVALHNVAQALARLGEYDEARRHLHRALALSRNLVGGRVASTLVALGDLHRALGEREQSLLAYDEAIALTRPWGERQLLIPALAGCARTKLHDDPDRARAYAEEALRLAPESLKAHPLIALALVALAEGARSDAVAFAGQAVSAARESRAPALLADALETLARADDHPERVHDALTEAHSIWSAAQAGPDAYRVEVLMARLEDADQATLDRGRRAAAQLRRLGVTRIAGRPVGVDPMSKDVCIRVLGAFEVRVRGREVAMQTWKSRQARTLVKLLAAHRGRPLSRLRVCEELWRDDDPAKTSHRLSVLLATVRGVFDPDRTWPSDHYLGSDNRGVWLDLRRVGLDADELIRGAEHGAELLAQGRDDEASAALMAVDGLYCGDAFEDDPYEDWASTMRDEVRAASVRSLRHLATLASRQGRSNDAAALLVRLLSADPYDERVHQGLVRTLVKAGRHGEARRAFDRWTMAMAVVDVAPPDLRVLVPQPGVGV